MIYAINFVNICMSDILTCVECLVCHCIALRWGVTQVGKFHYWCKTREIPISGKKGKVVISVKKLKFIL